jgi:CheY-like chemotaxis protein
MVTETRPYQILLAEDSAADVGIVRIALRDQGLDHVLHVARDGEEAISFIEKADKDRKAPAPDLLLLDMHRPKYDRAQKHAAMFYFRKPSRLDEFIQLGIIVRDILTGKKPLALSAAGLERKGGAA